MTENFSWRPSSDSNSYNRLISERKRGGEEYIRRIIPYGIGLIGLCCFSAAAHAGSAGAALSVGLSVLGVTSGVLGYYQEQYESKVEGREFNSAKMLKNSAVGFGYGLIGHYSPGKDKGFKSKAALRLINVGLAVVTMGVLPAAKIGNRIYTYRKAIKTLEKEGIEFISAPNSKALGREGGVERGNSSLSSHRAFDYNLACRDQLVGLRQSKGASIAFP